jgi:hypothetical protein
MRTPRAIAQPRRGLTRGEAALYVGATPAKFDDMVRDGRMPRPVMLDEEETFDLIQLDLAYDRLSGGAHEQNEWNRRRRGAP